MEKNGGTAGQVGEGKGKYLQVCVFHTTLCFTKEKAAYFFRLIWLLERERQLFPFEGVYNTKFSQFYSFIWYLLCSLFIFDFLIHFRIYFSVSSVQLLSRVRLLVTPWIAARQASLSITNSRSLLKLMPIESVMPSSHLILCHHLLLPPLPPSIRVFFNESTLPIRWPKYWSFSFSISPSNEHLGFISFRMDWLDLLAVQGTLESSPTPQFKSINFSVLSFLHSPNLTPIHDHWKNHSLDQTDLCWQSNISAF